MTVSFVIDYSLFYNNGDCKACRVVLSDLDSANARAEELYSSEYVGDIVLSYFSGDSAPSKLKVWHGRKSQTLSTDGSGRPFAECSFCAGMETKRSTVQTALF